jgi:hypothetical protein
MDDEQVTISPDVNETGKGIPQNPYFLITPYFNFSWKILGMCRRDFSLRTISL